MLSTPNVLRVNYRTGKILSGLPCIYTLTPWFPLTDGLPVAQQLFLTQNGCYLDQVPIAQPQGNPFLQTWRNGAPPNSDAGSDGEISLSWYYGFASTYTYFFGSFEFAEDGKSVLGIVGTKAADGQIGIAYYSGVAANAAATDQPTATIPEIENGDQYISAFELLTLTFPGLLAATGEALNDSFAWAFDQAWRSALFSMQQRPDLGGDVSRMQAVEAAAEWHNTVFGPAMIGNQLSSALSANRQAALAKYLTGADATLPSLGADPIFHHQHQTAAQAAMLKVQPRLGAIAAVSLAGDSGNELYPDPNSSNTSVAQAFYKVLSNSPSAFLERYDSLRPSITLFLAAACLNSSLQSAAMRFINRYASLLGVLDRTGGYEQQFRNDTVSAQLTLLVPYATFDDQNDITDVISALFNYVQNTTTPSTADDFQKWAKDAVQAVDGVDKLASHIAGSITLAATTSDSDRSVNISVTASTALSRAYPLAGFSANAIFAVCQAYGVYAAMRAFLNDASPIQKTEDLGLFLYNIAYVVYNVGKGAVTIKSAFEKFSGGMDTASAVDEIEALKNAVFSDEHLASVLSEQLLKLDPMAYLNAPMIAGIITRAGQLERLFNNITLIKNAVGPLIAAATLAYSIYQLIDDIRNGAPAEAIAMESFNVAVNAALVVCAVVDMALDVMAVTVIGIVVAAVATAVTVVLLLFSLFQSAKESSSQWYLEHVVMPFVDAYAAIPPITPKRQGAQAQSRLAEALATANITLNDVIFLGRQYPIS